VTRIGRLEKKKEEEENGRSQEDTIDGEKNGFACRACYSERGSNGIGVVKKIRSM
jgi:hypothetical protein